MNSILMRALYILILMLLTSYTGLSQQDAVKMREIIAMKASPEKADTLHKFKSEYAQSQLYNRANQELFNTYLQINETDSALHYADIFVNSLPASFRMNAYNGIAFSLAEYEMGLDTALVYADRALKMAANNPRYLSSIGDTKAYVLYKKGDPQSALEIQMEAIKGHEDDPEYLYHLALYFEGTGNTVDAIRNAGMAALYGDPGEAMAKLIEWGAKIDDETKNKIITSLVNNFINNSGSNDTVALRSYAASFMAQTGVNLDTANEWAENAVKTINEKTKVENYVNYKTSHAVVKAASGKFNEALKDLEEVNDLAEPWNGNYWLTMGKVYENLDKKEKALEAYASGLYVFENPPVLDAAKKIAHDQDIEKAIEKKKEEVSSFHVGTFDESSRGTDKVVLAELFTGAECGPCAAADIAFDNLSEYYPRNALAILEYHVHIPGPDPLTNPESFQRYNWYGADFGTPTVFFEGTEKITNGGPRIAALNRFNIYKHAIKKYLNNKPKVNISGDAVLNGNSIDITISVKPEEKITAYIKPVLFIALTEKSVNYTGANGIDKHIFVVRDFVDDPGGVEISLDKEISLKKTSDIQKLEAIITNYLTDPTKDPSWRAPQFAGWRLKVEELNNINEKNLAVVVWIQDSETKEVIQAGYFDVK